MFQVLSCFCTKGVQLFRCFERKRADFPRPQALFESRQMGVRLCRRTHCRLFCTLWEKRRDPTCT